MVSKSSIIQYIQFNICKRLKKNVTSQADIIKRIIENKQAISKSHQNNLSIALVKLNAFAGSMIQLIFFSFHCCCCCCYWCVRSFFIWDCINYGGIQQPIYKTMRKKNIFSVWVTRIKSHALMLTYSVVIFGIFSSQKQQRPHRD